MQEISTQSLTKKSFLFLHIKYGSILLLVLLSVLIVACSSGSNTTANGGNTLGSGSTAVIHLNNTNLSPTPSLAPYWCGAWITKSTIPYDPNGVVALYAKYTRNVDGNPVGVAGAQVQALIHWGDGTTPAPLTQTTSADGLAVFFVPIGDKEGAMNKLSLVTFTFSAPGATTCTVDDKRPASFVVTAPAATPTPTHHGKHNNDNNNDNNN